MVASHKTGATCMLLMTADGLAFLHHDNQERGEGLLSVSGYVTLAVPSVWVSGTAK
jgi:hypothetical protein